MYGLTKSFALRIMKAPTEPPDPPAGSHEQIQVYRASPRYLTYRLLGFWMVLLGNALWILGMFVAGAVTGKWGLQLGAVLLMVLLAVVMFFVYFAVRIDYDMRYYIVTDRSLRVREGAFIIKEKTLSYANVQNLRVVQGPLLRFFGIWHLKIDTAGGGTSKEGQPDSGAHRVRMAGIENAHEVRDIILGHLKRRGVSAGLGDFDDRDDDATTSSEFLTALRELQHATAALRTATDHS